MCHNPASMVFDAYRLLIKDVRENLASARIRYFMNRSLQAVGRDAVAFIQ